MPFFLHRVVGTGTQLQRVSGNTLRIGRGAGCELRLPDDAAVELEHALIREDEKGHLLVDLGSVTGTYVNGQPVDSARLANDDRIEIGGTQIRVQRLHPEDPLFLHVRPVVTAAPGAPLAAARIDYAAAYGLRRRRLFTKGGLSLAAVGAAAIAALWVAAGARAGLSTAPRPGPVSVAHAEVGIAARCGDCHLPWQGASSARCERCHAGPEHQPAQAFNPPCSDCHTEHRKLPALARVTDGRCVACHQDLARRDGGEPRVARRITGFGDHPGFRPRQDATRLKLNHELHLKPGLLGPRRQRVQLDCASCHGFDAERGEILPVVFEQHCQGCHDLAFDDRLPEQQAPHGAPDEVLTGILGAYARDRDLLARLSPEELRRLIFGGSSRTGLSFDERTRRLAFTAAEQMLRYRCTVCHQVELRSVVDARVAPPAIPERWLEAARFSHGPHRLYECEDCHTTARGSRRTADLLLPDIGVCRRCHGGAGAEAVAEESRGPSGCVTCHPYHEKSKTGWEATLPGRMGAAAPAPTAAQPGGATTTGGR